jgi:hypothetical protein
VRHKQRERCFDMNFSHGVSEKKREIFFISIENVFRIAERKQAIPQSQQQQHQIKLKLDDLF